MSLGSDKKCCVPGCKGSDGTHQVLHTFPNPAKERDRFNSWIKYIGGDILGLANAYIHKYRRVCHSHFETKYLCRFNRISKDAVPTINIPAPTALPRFTCMEQRPLANIQDTPPTSKDQHMNTNSLRNDGLPQQVYNIQLDTNVHIESQAIPLCVLENGLEENLILPFMQPKHGQPLHLLNEPQSTKVDNEYQRSRAQNEITPNNQIQDTSTNIVRLSNLDHTDYSVLFNKQLKAPGQPVFKKDPTIETAVENVEIEVASTFNKERSQKQKIKNFGNSSS